MADWKYHTPERDGHAPDDWADDVWEKALEAAENAEPDPTKDTGKRYDAYRGIAVIRSMCRPIKD